MAVISQVKVGSSTYDIKDAHNGVEYIRGTWTAASGTWTGVSTDTELYDGKKIILFMPYAGSGDATLNLTLADGTTTGAKNVYFESTNRFTTHKGQYSHIELIYHKAHQIGSTTYEGWWYLANRDTTVNYSLRNASNLYVTEAIPANSIIVGDNNGYKKAQIGATFYLDYPILWCTQARTANTQNGAENYFVSNGRTVTTAYSSFTGGVAKSELYLVATVAGRVATIVSPFLTCTVPTSEDGKVYFPIGIMASTTVVDFCSIGSERFAYIDGQFQPLGGAGNSAFGGVEMHGVTLPVNGWSSNQQTVTINSNAIASSDYLSIPQASTASAYTEAGVALSSATLGSGSVTLTFTCTTTPTTALDTVILVSTSEMKTESAMADFIANGPKIENGKWYTYNVATGSWVNSGVVAGITSITQTTTSTANGGNNIITAKLSDNTTTTFTIKNGQKGDKGDKGDAGATLMTATISLASGSWTASGNLYTQSAAISWMLSTDIPFCQGVCNNSTDAENWGQIIKATSSNGSITFTALEPLSANLSVQIVVLR